MCGICGFTSAVDCEADRAILKSMCGVMAHRGPDGEGFYLADGVALGHRRLALVDLAGGGQPMIREESQLASDVWTTVETPNGTRSHSAGFRRGRWSIVFNGEIYNYRELRAELEQAGFSFTTESDTEVLLVGYIFWSEAVLDRLRGMFAFAIYDASSKELFCARDPFGIKPFYYTVQNRSCPDGRKATAPDDRTDRPKSTFVFASEIKSLLEHPAYARELNEEALAHYLCFQFNPLDETFFKGVYKLPQGHCLRVHADGDIALRRYWQPDFRPAEGISEEQAVAQVHAAIRESVRFHNVADVEVGSFLSSGIDSSYLAACLARENPAIKTFTVGFAEYEGERDEVSWAQELARKLGVRNDSHHVFEEEYWQALPLVQWHMDEPAADPSAVALFHVDKLAARRVKAVLSGEGADELFGGYRIYQAPLASARMEKLPKPLLRAGSKVLGVAGMRGSHYLERASGHVRDWYYTNANDVAFSAGDRERLLSAGVRDRLKAMRSDIAGQRLRTNSIPTPQELVSAAYEEASHLDEPTQMQYVDMQFWLVGDILLKTDKMAMAHSLESRVPFLDRGVFQVAAAMPTRLKVSGHQTKMVLRQASEQVIPYEWARKEKLGFPVPLAGWLRDDAHYLDVESAFTSEDAKRFFNADYLVRLLVEHREGKADNSRRIWIVYSFLVWYRVFFVERTKPEC